MARLTRMQKYAGLREQMANDREASVSTNELNEYEDKLRNIQVIDQSEKILDKSPDIIETKVEVNDYEPNLSFEKITKEFDSSIDNTFKKEEDSFYDFLATLGAGKVEKPIEKSNNLDPFANFQIDDIKIEKSVFEKPSEKVEPKSEEPAFQNIDDVFSKFNFSTDEKPTIKEESIAEFEKPREETIVKEEPAVVENFDETFSNLTKILTEDTAEISSVKKYTNEEPDITFVEPIAEFEETIKEEPVIEETKPEIIEESKIEEYTQPSLEEPILVKEVKKEVEPINYEPESFEDIASKLASINTEINGEVEQVKEEEKTVEQVKPTVEFIEPSLEEPIQDEPVIEETKSEIIEESKIEEYTQPSLEESIKEEPYVVPQVNSKYVKDTLKEVENYNRNDGQKTIDEISQSMIDSIRHPEVEIKKEEPKPQEEIKEEPKKIISDEEFSNTVTLEIDKVLNEISINTNNEAPEIKIDIPIKPIDIKPEVYAEKIANTIEHPVLTKSLEDEPIEIRPMEETLRQDVLNDTIPFNVNNEEENEEYEEDAPNKVLNVILVILIFILIAILGIIVYYILFAKGIIG